MLPLRRFRIEKHLGLWNVYDRVTGTNTRFYIWTNAIRYTSLFI